MADAPAVSVLMAAYNAERYLAPAIESIQAQALTNWELVICDDGSTDSTKTLCAEFSRRDPRIKPISTDQNRGMSAARNHAFSVSRAPLIAMMDADDLSLPQRLQMQVEWACRFPAEIICTGYTPFGDVREDDCDLYLPVELTQAALWVTTPVCGPSMMLHRDLYQRLGGYCESIRHDTEDIELLLRAARAGHRVRMIPASLYRYRVHARSHCGQDRRRFWQRYDQFNWSYWNTHLSQPDRRRELFDMAVAGLRSADWPAGRTALFRRKAAGIAVLLAIRFSQMGDRREAARLLNEALHLYPWRPDAYASLLLLPFGWSLQVTAFGHRRAPYLLIRRFGRLQWVI